MLTRHLTCFSYTPSGSTSFTSLTWKLEPVLSSLLFFESENTFHGNLCFVVNQTTDQTNGRLWTQTSVSAVFCFFFHFTGCSRGLLFGFKESKACKSIKMPVKLRTFLRPSVTWLRGRIRLQTSPFCPSCASLQQISGSFPSLSLLNTSVL